MGRSEAEASLRRRERKPSEGGHPCPANPAERRAGRAARTALACFAALSVVACGGPDDPDSDPATDHPDSDVAAGGLDGPDVMLSAVTEPAYTVGEAVGEDWELLGRVASLSFDDAGSLYLFDAGAQRIVVVGPDGEFARFVGGPGEGPGEFDEASAMAVLPSGRIAVFEFGLPGTFEIFEADGTFVESLSVDATSEMAMPPAMREAIERQIEEMTFPDGIPVVAGLAADREGRLWIERSSQDRVEDGPIDIVTPDGGYVGTLGPDGPRLPNAFGPAGLMAYLVEDDLGVQTVRVIRLASLDR